MRAQFWDQEDPLEEGMATHSCLENPHGWRSLQGYSSQGRKQSDMTEVTQHVAHRWEIPFKYSITAAYKQENCINTHVHMSVHTLFLFLQHRVPAIHQGICYAESYDS